MALIGTITTTNNIFGGKRLKDSKKKSTVIKNTH
jgi:hypothetical protein